MQSRHNTFTEARSVSLDRYRYDNAGVSHKMRKQITIGDHSRTYQTPGIRPTSDMKMGNPIFQLRY